MLHSFNIYINIIYIHIYIYIYMYVYVYIYFIPLFRFKVDKAQENFAKSLFSAFKYSKWMFNSKSVL